MIVLGIESATARAGCAIGTEDGVIASAQVTRGPRHAEVLTPAIQFVCAQAGIALSEVGAIAVDIGPGLFTGLRVGMATANGLAQALEIPMVGVCSLDLLAYGVRHTDRRIVAVIDARRAELYCAAYATTPHDVKRIIEPHLVAPHQLAAELAADPAATLLVGDGFERYGEVFDGLAQVARAGRNESRPSPEVLVEIAAPIAARGEAVAPAGVAPLYLRKSDAELNWERRGA